jgi:hypothetical protein
VPLSAPHAYISLSRVIGHNAGYRQNIHYGRGRSLIYPAGAVGVVLDLESNQQRLYVLHTDKIACLRIFRVRRRMIISVIVIIIITILSITMLTTPASLPTWCCRNRPAR